MTTSRDVDIAVIGAGFAGIATAYYLCTEYGKRSVLLIDSGQPMGYTSAQSGDNYRNWWPHPTMVKFTDYSIDLMERIALDTSNVLHMTRRGYTLNTRRADIDDLVEELHAGYGREESGLIRIQTSASPKSYCPLDVENWTAAPNGVDVLSNGDLIRRTFPSFSDDIANVLHIRRAGDVSGQQMGQYMLERIKEAGGKQLRARVKTVQHQHRFVLEVDASVGVERVNAEVIVNAAGPFASHISKMIGIELPIENVFQQKLAFDDKDAAIPRQLPFSLDLDEKELDWTAEERELVAEDPDLAWLVRTVPSGTHCRPEGGNDSRWIKLGWAYNRDASKPRLEYVNDPHYDAQFPEIILRAAAALNPSLKQYSESFPSRWIHYGGYYPMTHENWPLIGPLGGDGAFVVGALSGYGCMSACAAGSMCAAWISDGELPDYADQLSLARYDDQELMAKITNTPSKGIL